MRNIVRWFALALLFAAPGCGFALGGAHTSILSSEATNECGTFLSYMSTVGMTSSTPGEEFERFGKGCVRIHDGRAYSAYVRSLQLSAQEIANTGEEMAELRYDLGEVAGTVIQMHTAAEAVSVPTNPTELVRMLRECGERKLPPNLCAAAKQYAESSMVGL